MACIHGHSPLHCQHSECQILAESDPSTLESDSSEESGCSEGNECAAEEEEEEEEVAIVTNNMRSTNLGDSRRDAFQNRGM